MASAMSSTRMQRLDELGGVGQACIMAWRVLPNYCRHVVIQVGFSSQSDFSLMKAVFDS
jgi:hypothetical protein